MQSESNNKKNILDLAKKYENEIFNDESNYQREIFDELYSSLKNHNLVLIGLRQIGKTTLMKQLGKKYYDEYLKTNDRNNKISLSKIGQKSKIFYLNLKAINIDNIANEFLINLISANKYKLILLDEIQVLPNWSDFLQSLIDLNNQARFIVSGSNASALKKEIMVNRNKVYFINTLSFLEFEKIWGISDIELYLKYGSYPQSQQYKDPEIQYRELVESVVIDKIINEDLEKSIDINKFKQLMKNILNYIGNELALSKLENKKITRQTAKSYIQIMSEARLIHLIPKYQDKNEKRKNKIYFEDKSMIYFFNNFDDLDNNTYGGFIENIILFYLNKKYANKLGLPNIFYYRNSNDNEIDFLVEREKILIECKYQKNLDVEKITTSLNDIIKNNFSDYRKIIVTKDIDKKLNGWELISLKKILRGENEL
ncbi:MAG: ATP-binding protein [Metamycoplasmataceae bacterium]